jgi:hypothetical protein
MSIFHIINFKKKKIMDTGVLDFFNKNLILDFYFCLAPTLACSIRYKYIFVHQNLQFLNHVIITKAKVLLPQANVTLADFGYPV